MRSLFVAHVPREWRTALGRVPRPSQNTIRVMVVFASIYAAAWLAAMTAAVVALNT
jgi:hypothetical protein